nr:capsid protein [Water buffalo astrovirus]
MASKQRRATRTTNNTSVVVRNGPAPSGAGRRRRRRRAQSRKPKIVVLPTTQKVQVSRFRPRGKGINNNVVRQRITTTLGTIGANSNGEIETEMTMIINPATMKESTASNAYGPLNIYASTYSLWRLSFMDVKLTPLIGSSAVSGTMVRLSYNPTNSPTMTSWSAIGARYHVDATPGQHVKFHIDGKKLKGCKDGWYKTNTTGDPMMPFAGVVEAHSIGQTKSTYKNENYDGPLFMVEVTSEWEFTAYAQQPGLLNLKKGTDDANATVTTDANGKLQMVLPPTSRLARAASPTQPSEIIWMVADTVFTAGASAFPPPFSWLLRGGWWLLKRAAGAPVLRNGGVTFDVYESIQNARAGVPCLTTVQNGSWAVGSLHYTQLTPGNIGIEETPPVQRVTQPAPRTTYVVSARRYKFNANELVPSFPVFYHPFDGSQNFTTGVGFKADGQIVSTYNVLEVEVANDIGNIDPDVYLNKLPIYLFYEGREKLMGFAVASEYDTQSDNTLRYTVYTLLVYATATDRYNFIQRWKGTKVIYPTDDQYRTKIETPDAGTQGSIRFEMVAGRWYLIQYMYTGNADRYYVVGDDRVAQHASDLMRPGGITIPTRLQDSNKALINVYGAGLHLRTFTSGEANVEQAQAQAIEQEDMADALEDLALLDDDLALEMEPDDHYSDPPMSRLYVRPTVEDIYKMVLDRGGTERQARLAANQVDPSDDYIRFNEMYHDAIIDGLSPEDARRHALGL